MRLLFFANLALLTVSITSCATITHGTKEVLQVETIPTNAFVELASGKRATSPAFFKIYRKDTVFLTISKVGYKTKEIKLPAQMSSSGGLGMAGNVLVGGIIGAGVDTMSGAMYAHKPNPLVITLEKE